ncbi:hypothetical protein SLA2020_415890 [Shorea laevis]
MISGNHFTSKQRGLRSKLQREYWRSVCETHIEEMAELESFASEDVVKGDRYSNDIPTWKTSETPPLSSWKAA